MVSQTGTIEVLVGGVGGVLGLIIVVEAIIIVVLLLVLRNVKNRAPNEYVYANVI